MYIKLSIYIIGNLFNRYKNFLNKNENGKYVSIQNEKYELQIITTNTYHALDRRRNTFLSLFKLSSVVWSSGDILSAF